MSTPYAELPLVAPGDNSGLVEVLRRRYLLRLLVRRELNARYSGSVLGLLWSYVNPLSQLFIYWVVMGKIMGLDKGIENFAVHIFVGLIAVHFFNETFNAGTRSIARNKSLVQKMALPLEMFPVASMLVSATNAFPSFIILTIVCGLSGWVPDPMGMLYLVIACAIMAAIGTGLALVFSVANVFFRDFAQLVTILTNFVRFGVPMMYPFTRVADLSFVEYYLANPLAMAVLMLQRAFWAGSTGTDMATMEATHFPDHLLLRGCIALVASLVVLALGQLVFSRLQNKIPERI